MTTTRLDSIRFYADSPNFASTYGYQEVDADGNLIHLYDRDGDQLDSGNGSFPNATWYFRETVGTLNWDDEDDSTFWNLIAESEARIKEEADDVS